MTLRVGCERLCALCLRAERGVGLGFNGGSGSANRTVGGEDPLLNLECEDGGDLTLGLMDDRFGAVDVDEKEVLYS